MRYYIVGPKREVVWPNWFNSRAQAEQWRKRWDCCTDLGLFAGCEHRSMDLQMKGAETMSTDERKEVCTCGDYRSSHPKDGPCEICKWAPMNPFEPCKSYTNCLTPPIGPRGKMWSGKRKKQP